MSAISKTTITFTVLHRTGDEGLVEAGNRDYGHYLDSPLGYIMQESWDGGMVGVESEPTTVPVPASKVERELLAMGNDGTFFEGDDLDNEAPSLALAHPASPEVVGVGSCGFCFRPVHKVPGGHGPTWVHDGSGMKFCDKEDA